MRNEIRLNRHFCFEHDLFRKPVSTFRDHALAHRGCWRARRGRFVGHARLGKRRHAGMTGERRAQNEHGERRARGLAEPHVEREQRMKPKLIEQFAMPRFGGNVAR